MQYTQFGNTGMQVSRFCLGAMTFPNQLDKRDSQRIIDEALDAGVNFIDTADSYGDSQKVLGEILPPEKRERVYLATKVFRKRCRDKQVGRNSRVNIIDSLHRSLRRLNTDYVDLFQLHHPDPDTPLEETLEVLDTLIKRGEIRYVGVSNHYAWQMAVMIGQAKVNGLQPPISLQADYSILERQIEQECAPFLLRFNMALMCYGPLCGGILTGKYLDGIPEGSRATKNKSLVEYIEDERVREIVRAVAQVASENNLQPNQAAILWLLAKPHVTCPILGGTKPEHFSSLYEVADQALPAEAVKAIDDASSGRVLVPYRNQPQRAGAPLGAQW